VHVKIPAKTSPNCYLEKLKPKPKSDQNEKKAKEEIRNDKHVLLIYVEIFKPIWFK
jgi:hypothetical protein